MVLNTWFERAPLKGFKPANGDAGHLLCTQLVESDVSGLSTLSMTVNQPHDDQLVNWLDRLGLTIIKLLDFSQHYLRST